MSNDDEIIQAKQEAADTVVGRVASWHEGAEPQTLREELAEGFEESGVHVDREQIDDLARDIHDPDTADSEQPDPS